MSADYWRRWPAPLTFTQPGDKAEGLIVALGDMAEKWPEIHIRQADGIVRIVRVTQSRLHELLSEAVPCIGDRIRITYTGDAKRAVKGYSPTKEFTVEIRRKDPSGDRAEATATGSASTTSAAAKTSENGPRAGT